MNSGNAWKATKEILRLLCPLNYALCFPPQNYWHRIQCKIIPLEDEVLSRENGKDDSVSVHPLKEINLSPLTSNPIRFIPFDKFKTLGTTPRYPDNKHLCVALSEIDLENSLLIFISHCWLRGWSGAVGFNEGLYAGYPHPDNAAGGKYQLIVDGVEQFMKLQAPGFEKCFLWIDYGCIDQNGDPAGELKQLDKIIEVCDCLFTPVFDENHASWEIPDVYTNLFDAYKSEGWIGNDSSYVNRGWCRVEMFYGANIPFKQDSEERRGKMKAGLLFHRKEGRRPHILYGSYDKARGITPQTLPPLQNSHFEEYHPTKGNLTVSSDREKIITLVEDLARVMKKSKIGYVGVRSTDGKMHGNGTFTFPTGDVYEGEYKDGKRHGQGKFTFTSGDVYEGEWTHGNKHGMGKLTCADGDVYEGEWKDNLAHKGKFTYAAGGVYEGEWKEGKRHGQGKFTSASGDVYEGEWKEDKRLECIDEY